MFKFLTDTSFTTTTISSLSLGRVSKKFLLWAVQLVYFLSRSPTTKQALQNRPWSHLRLNLCCRSIILIAAAGGWRLASSSDPFILSQSRDWTDTDPSGRTDLYPDDNDAIDQAWQALQYTLNTSDICQLRTSSIIIHNLFTTCNCCCVCVCLGVITFVCGYILMYPPPLSHIVITLSLLPCILCRQSLKLICEIVHCYTPLTRMDQMHADWLPKPS